MMTGYVEVIVKLVNKRNAGRDVQLCDFILRDVVQIFNQSTQRVAVSCDQNLLASQHVLLDVLFIERNYSCDGVL